MNWIWRAASSLVLALLLLAMGIGAPSAAFASTTQPEFVYDVADHMRAGALEAAAGPTTAPSACVSQSRAAASTDSPIILGADVHSPRFVAPNTTPTVRGTSVRGEVTSRPGSFRNGTLQNAWDDAAVGPNGGRLCPSCDGEVLVSPGSGVPRDWDGSHNPSWSNREFPGDVQRPDVLDNFNEGVSVECPGCNRPPGNNDTRFGDARSGWPD